MKYIYLDFLSYKHSLYNNLINYPPLNYKFIVNNSKPQASTANIDNFLYSNILAHFFPVKFFKTFQNSRKKIPKKCNFIYNTGHLNLGSKPWVVDLEYATHLIGYQKNYFQIFKTFIKNQLEKENCKAIIPWTKMGKKTLQSSFKSKKIDKKTKVVHLAVPYKPIKKVKKNNSKTIFLFVNSINFPEDFYKKGGLLALQMFKQLQKKHKNVQLIMRSKVPLHIKKIYSKIKDIIFIEKTLPFSELETLFLNADIFLLPSHGTPGLVFLDAMSYGLPIITTNVWANPEMVIDNYNGLVIQKSSRIGYHDKNYIPLWSENSFNRQIKKGDEKVVRRLIKAAEMLLFDSNLRKRLGSKGLHEIKEGKFSISYRNSKLKEIFNLI